LEPNLLYSQLSEGRLSGKAELERLKRVLETAKELASLYSDTYTSLQGLPSEISLVEELIQKNRFKEVGKKLMRMGLIFLAVPEPLASNLCGSLLLTTGFLFSRLNKESVDWENLHLELHKSLHDLHKLKKEIASLHF
jgi:hypothetical protein